MNLNIISFDKFKLRDDIKDLPLNEQHRKYFYYKSDLLIIRNMVSSGGRFSDGSSESPYYDDDYTDDGYV